MLEKINLNKTVVLVSHKKGLIKGVCDRVIWIDDVYIRSAGNPSDVMDKYTKKLMEGN